MPLRTAQQAADGLGVALGQIAKSIIFRRKTMGRPCWSSPRARRVFRHRALSRMLVCENGHRVFHRRGVTRWPMTAPLSATCSGQIWAAAGHPHAVFGLQPQNRGLDGCARADDRDQPLMIMTGRLAWVSTFAPRCPESGFDAPAPVRAHHDQVALFGPGGFRMPS